MRLEPAVVQPLRALFDKVVSDSLSGSELGHEEDSTVAEEFAVALPGVWEWGEAVGGGEGGGEFRGNERVTRDRWLKSLGV